MSKLRSTLAAALCLLAAAPAHARQQPAPTKQPETKPAAPARAAADPLAANRRATAVQLLNSLADEARSFRDPNLRARVQAQTADALWETEPERARALFRRAWDAAEQADLENVRRQRGEEQQRAAGAGVQRNEEVRAVGGRPAGLATLLGLPQMRSEVLRLAARRDRALGEEFLSKLEEARRQDERSLSADAVAGAASAPGGAPAPAAGAPAAPPRDPNEVSPADARRLRLAMQFIEEGDLERAVQFAVPALNLGTVNTTAVEFLVNLREKDATVADQQFLALLTRAAADPATNANSVLILSSYVLTPHLYISFGPSGMNSSQRRGEIRTPDIPASVRTAFAQFASRVLLRPLPPPDQDPRGYQRGLTYFVIGRLLPFFEQTLGDGAAALRAQLTALSPDIPQARRDEMEDDMRRGFVPDSQRAGENLQQALDSAARATDPAQRDRYHLRAALIASRQADPKARDYADKIDDAGLRQQARSFVAFTFLNHAVRRNDGAEVFRLAASPDLTHTQRTWAYTEAARLLLKDDRPRALESLEAAFAAARQIDAEDSDRPRAIVAVATQYAEADRGRAWELMAEAVKAANAAPDFTGSDAGMAARVQSGGMSSIMNFPAPTFDLTGVFQTLGRDDMNRAVALAQTFTHESPRAVATLAVARAVLEERKPAAPRPNRASQ
jgi:hypothetical protein